MPIETGAGARPGCPDHIALVLTGKDASGEALFFFFNL